MIEAVAKVFGQLIGSGVIAFLATAAVLLVVSIREYQSNGWIYGALAAFFLVWMVVPHGWNIVFPPEPSWEQVLHNRSNPSESSYLLARFLGLLLGSAAAFIMKLFRASSSRW
ncbi:hypothetical protein [Pseudomonas syringae]|uniref:hypothetical protein n=1 Tax=Pseudomonas syringae TaxID=317 RepID=UPI0013C37763|nr:hypothetical protein [Pseudomonas syringae]